MEVGPYRDGSKVVAEVDVQLSPTSTDGGSKIVDVKEIIDTVKGEVEAVVKS